MNSLGRISLLFGAVILLVFGVICLKQQMTSDLIQGDSVSADNAGKSAGSTESPAVKPMVLSHSGIGDQNGNIRPVELSPVQLGSHYAEQRITPNEGPSLIAPTNSFPDSPADPDSKPFQHDPPTAVSAAVLLAPVGIDNAVPERTNADHASRFQTAAEGDSVGNGVFADDSASRQNRTSRHTLPQTVVTVADDSLWNISKRLYGRGDFYKALWLHNQSVIPRPDRIPPGISVVAPNVDELRQLYPDACPAADDDATTSS